MDCEVSDKSGGSRVEITLRPLENILLPTIVLTTVSGVEEEVGKEKFPTFNDFPSRTPPTQSCEMTVIQECDKKN